MARWAQGTAVFFRIRRASWLTLCNGIEVMNFKHVSELSAEHHQWIKFTNRTNRWMGIKAMFTNRRIAPSNRDRPLHSPAFLKARLLCR